MKKLLFALALLILTTQGAFAITSNPDTDKLTIGQWAITSTDTLVPTSSASRQEIVENYTTANTANALLENESGKIISDTGASTDGSCNTAGWGGSKHTLPRAKVGLTYTLTAGSKCYVTLDTIDTSDIIRYSVSGTLLDAGDSVKSTGQAGDSVTVVSTVAGKWDIKEMKGTWTDNSTN